MFRYINPSEDNKANGSTTFNLLLQQYDIEVFFQIQTAKDNGPQQIARKIGQTYTPKAFLLL